MKTIKTHFKHIGIVLALLCVYPGHHLFGQSAESPYEGFATYDQWLSTYVTNEGAVNYQKATADGASLADVVSQWQRLSPKGMSSTTAKAYWINLYNAVMLQVILDHYPVSSVRDIDNGETWKVQRVCVDGDSLSLDNIEHRILRPTYQDARIHFAVNCAARSCPKLLNRAFHPDQMESQLDQQARYFIQDKTHNRFDADVAKLSQIFSWYKEDFGADLLGYIRKYSDTDISTGARVEFLPYDWSLNGQ